MLYWCLKIPIKSGLKSIPILIEIGAELLSDLRASPSNSAVTGESLFRRILQIYFLNIFFLLSGIIFKFWFKIKTLINPVYLICRIKQQIGFNFS